jgi:hypothetical protein
VAYSVENSPHSPRVVCNEKIDLTERPRFNDRGAGNGLSTTASGPKIGIKEFIECKGLPRPEATLKSHGIECQD